MSLLYKLYNVGFLFQIIIICTPSEGRCMQSRSAVGSRAASGYPGGSSCQVHQLLQLLCHLCPFLDMRDLALPLTLSYRNARYLKLPLKTLQEHQLMQQPDCWLKSVAEGTSLLFCRD